MNEKTLRVLEFNTIKEMLLNHTLSLLGKEFVNKLLPSTNYNEIIKMQQETTEGLKAVIKRGNPPLGGLYDIRPSLKKAKLDAILTNIELLNISQVYRIARLLKKYASESGDDSKLKIIDGLISGLFTDKSIESQINDAIINENEISDNASVTLKNIRKQIIDINASIKSKLNSIISSSKYQKYLQDNLITIRDGRYVVPVKQEYRANIPGLVHDSSASGATLFVEPMAVVEANNKLKELIIKEKVEIENILRILTGLVAGSFEELESNISILGELDFIFAKGKLSLKLDCNEPKINRNGYIKLKKARHPLIDKSKVVPIDIELVDGVNTLVITGPNTGGKTVTLKTVGLFVLMAQCGLHLPVKNESEISIFNKVFADIGDEQSIEQNLSTFSAHMTNIVQIIQHADDNSLCLFDELGAGTDPTEGAALAMSILSNLHNRDVKTIATTHYSELKMFALSNNGFQNASCEFDVETLKPTYRVLMGIPGKSNAFEISKRLGLQDNIIQNAKEYISKEDIKFEDVISDLHKEKEIAEGEAKKAQHFRREMELLKRTVEKEKRELANKKQNILIKARQDALEILENAREEADEIIEEMKKLVKIQQQQEREKLLKESQKKLKSSFEKHEKEITKSAVGRTDDTKPPESVEIGQQVFVVNIDQNGQVLSQPDKNGDLQIQVGIMKINSNLKHLRIIKENFEKTKKQYDKYVSTKSMSISPEMDVRGEYLDDALIKLDKYLDDAYLGGLTLVTIIHGKGTGVLRSGIHKFLKSHAHVKSYRIGNYGEGDSGVTVVELK